MKNLKRNCPECKVELHYSGKNIYRAIKLNGLCGSCSKKEKNNPNFENVGKNLAISKSLIGNKRNLGKYRTDEQKRIHSNKIKQFCQTPKGRECIKNRTQSIRKIRSLLGTQSYHPNFNKKACEFFDYLNKELNWNGIHALNGGEYYIVDTGNWVDYYEPTLNLVIEWDESTHHYKNGKLDKKDILREQQIINVLKCKFIRLKQNNDYVASKNIILDYCKK